MDCHSSTSVSEFLAGLSLLCLGVNAGIMFLMRPQFLHVRFDPIWNTPRTITNVKSSPMDQPSNSDDEEQCGDGDEDEPDTPISHEKVVKGKGGFYSYFT